MIGMTMSHTAPSGVAPTGLDKVFGTNPLAVGAPVADRDPFVLDMATTAASGTRVMFARRRGDEIPWGLVADADGLVTTDGDALASGGSLLPLGSTPESGANKGFGLALVVDILSGVMSGTGSGLFQTFGSEWRQGYWMAAWRLDLFVEPDDFKNDMAAMADAIHASRPRPGIDRVTIPGDRAIAERSERARNGIPLDDRVQRLAHELASDVGVPFPEPLA
jgi:LDH2 family malate/lactate/ureidoglycolate dehydrogenase